MAAKFILILTVAVFSVALAMPSSQNVEAERLENMKTAETISLGIGIGIPGFAPYGYRRGYPGYPGYPYYGPYDYSGFLPRFMHPY